MLNVQAGLFARPSHYDRLAPCFGIDGNPRPTMSVESPLPALMQSPAGLTAVYLRELLVSWPAGNALLTDMGIDATRLASDDRYRVPLYQAFALLERAVAASGDPLFALRSVERLTVRAFPWLGYAVLAAGSLREAVRELARLEPLIWDAGTITLDEHNDEAWLIWEARLPTPTVAVEMALAGWVKVGQALLQREQHGHRVCFRHTARTDAAAYAPLFGAPVAFGAEHNAVILPRAWLDESLPFADPRLGELVRDKARTLLSDPGLNLENEIRARCFGALPGPLPELDQLAEDLDLPARQLRQLLADRALNLRELQDGVRRELAFHLLRDPARDLADIAGRCGFSEQSAFHRAFRRWTGSTPAAWRQTPQP